MNSLNPFTREFWVMDEPTMSVPPGPEAVRQAHYSALALEADREQLRNDLLCRLNKNKADREQIEAALHELDALRILEKAG